MLDVRRIEPGRRAGAGPAGFRMTRGLSIMAGVRSLSTLQNHAGAGALRV
jgi:hypothetical protein